MNKPIRPMPGQTPVPPQSPQDRAVSIIIELLDQIATSLDYLAVFKAGELIANYGDVDSTFNKRTQVALDAAVELLSDDAEHAAPPAPPAPMGE